MDVVGFALCRGCGNWIPEELTKPFGGWCPTCAAMGATPVPRREARLRIDGASVVLPPSRRSRSHGNRETRNKREKAKRAAERRLAHVYPTLYRHFLAQERAARGLDPFPPGSPGGQGDLEADLAEAENFKEAYSYPVDVIGADHGLR